MNRRLVTIDTHAHFYPCYDYQQVWKTIVDSAVQMLWLAERFDMRYFRDMREGRHPFGKAISLQPASGGQSVRLTDQDGHETWVVPGRQIVTKERLEVVALTIDLELPDGRPAGEVVAAIRDAGGLPLLNWAPGKWLGARGRIVAALIDQAAPGTLYVGDTTLRPAGCPDAVLMRRAAARGLSILAGSDPLPFRGEERRIGQYGIELEMDWNPDTMVDDLRNRLKAGTVQRFGRRDFLVSVFRRLWILRQQKKTGSARHG